MYEKLDECPICSSTSFHNKCICQDYLISGESFALTECNQCQFLFTNPRPSKTHIPKYYQSPDYQPHRNKNNSLIDYLYTIVRNFSLNKKYKLIKHHSTHETGQVLDVGSGNGVFLNFMKKKGWKTTGIEFDETARLISQQKYGLNIENSIFNLKVKKQYHVVTLWHTLEHVYDLNDTLSKVKELKTKKGKIFIAVPNISSFDAHYFKEFWAAYDVPRHLYHFTPETMKALLKKHKLKITHTHPLTFDSFYVSLLSTKYQYSYYNFIKALYVGLKSNREAKNTGQYSSLIYVVK